MIDSEEFPAMTYAGVAGKNMGGLFWGCLYRLRSCSTSFSSCNSDGLISVSWGLDGGWGFVGCDPANFTWLSTFNYIACFFVRCRVLRSGGAHQLELDYPRQSQRARLLCQWDILELELIQPQMAQKPVLRGEVGCACVARDVSVERGGMDERGCARRLGGWVWV